MTRPRCVLPDKTYLITRRCSERRFFLRPDREVTRLFEYLLAIACERFDMELHAYLAMSNHYHLVLTDPHANLPDFEQYFNSLLARSINCFRGRWESFWDPDSYSAVDLIESQDVFERLIYTLMNPVEANLVNRAEHWEGASSLKMRFNMPTSVSRPEGFFSEDMPESGNLKVVPPAALDGYTPEGLYRAIHDRVRGEENKQDRSKRVLGMSKVRAQHWNDSPETFEQRRGLNPRIAARRHRARIDALQINRDWLASYYSALALFRAGQRDVPFPRGTYWMCVRLGCSSAG